LHVLGTPYRILAFGFQVSKKPSLTPRVAQSFFLN
jgi:hypothetical protein